MVFVKVKLLSLYMCFDEGNVNKQLTKVLKKLVLILFTNLRVSPDPRPRPERAFFVTSIEARYLNRKCCTLLKKTLDRTTSHYCSRESELTSHAD